MAAAKDGYAAKCRLNEYNGLLYVVLARKDEKREMKYRPGYLLVVTGFWVAGIYILANVSSVVGIIYSILGFILMIAHVWHLNAQRAILYQFFLYSISISLATLCLLSFLSSSQSFREVVVEHEWFWCWNAISLPISGLLYPENR